jgi:hypothetical protein
VKHGNHYQCQLTLGTAASRQQLEKKLSVAYDANFSDQKVEHKFEYHDSFVVWEYDTLVAVVFRK